MPPDKSYLNFDLLLSDFGESYQVRLIDSPGGQADHIFTLPFSDLELKSFIFKVGQNRGSIRSLHQVETIDIPSIKKLGGALYDCLFGGQIAERFRTSQEIARTAKKGLRIRLRLSGTPKLINVPWELLFDAAHNNYIGLSVNTPIIRKLDLASLPSLQQIEGTLKVLVMISSPEDHIPLDVEHEWQRINKATQQLQHTGRVNLKRIQPSLVALQRQLRRDEYHVFHYIGHGQFDQNENDGLLIMEDAHKKGHAVSGQNLGAILYDAVTIQLALLNSCKGGRASVTDPFAGVGQSLLQKGIAAVIAMQFEITDKAAITFSHEFYLALVDGYPVDAAVTEARKAIFAKANQLEWATPVLYTSIESGILLKMPQEIPKSEEVPKVRVLPKNETVIGKLKIKSSALLIASLAISTLAVGILMPKLLLNPSPSNKFVAKSIDKNTSYTKAEVSNVSEYAPEVNNSRVVSDKPKLILIPKGSFQMGSNEESDEKPIHTVTINYDFYMSQTEITFAQYDIYAEDKDVKNPYDEGWGRADRPVTNVTWHDAQAYAKWLSKKNDQHLPECRLPSEAEWEYAARAGSQTAYFWGSSIGKNNAVCESCGSQWDQKKTAPVAQFKANAFGLYDMHGNVWEWVQDLWHDNYQNAPFDGSAWKSGESSHRVFRGGSWNVAPFDLRSTYRDNGLPDTRDNNSGFRVVCISSPHLPVEKL